MKIGGLENAGILRTVNLKKAVNSHSTAEIKMISVSDKPDELRRYIGTPITVEDNERVLMRGKIDGLTFDNAFSGTTAVFHAVSLSAEMDKTNHNRVYQDTKKKYSDVINSLSNDSYSFQISDNSEGGKNDETLIIQQNETDFNFAVRIAKKLELFVFVDDVSSKCSMLLAKKIGGKSSSVKGEEIIIQHYIINECEERIIITSRNYYAFGSQIICNGFDYVIIGFGMNYKDGEEEFRYEALRTLKLVEKQNENGSVFIGKAKVVDNDDPDRLGRLQVEFLEYEDKLHENRLWIPYIANMTESDHGVMFIPDKNEIVSIYYSNSGCYACGCIREAKFTDEMKDVSIRTILTRNSKVEISEKCVEINAFDFNIKVEKNNASIETEKAKVSMSGDETLIKNDRTSVSVKGDAVKVIAGQKTQIKASEINIEGNSKVTIKTPKLDIG